MRNQNYYQKKRKHIKQIIFLSIIFLLSYYCFRSLILFFTKKIELWYDYLLFNISILIIAYLLFFIFIYYCVNILINFIVYIFFSQEEISFIFFCKKNKYIKIKIGILLSFVFSFLINGIIFLFLFKNGSCIYKSIAGFNFMFFCVTGFIFLANKYNTNNTIP